MLLHVLFVHSVAIYVHAIKRINVVPGRAVYCGALPTQSTDNLERRASAMRRSFCEIMDPPFNNDSKVRLRWLGDGQTICGAVNRRYLQSIPLVYVHFIEDHNSSTIDLDFAEQYFEELTEKLRRDKNQTVIRGLTCIQEYTKNLHILTYQTFQDFKQSCHHIGNPCSIEIVHRVLDRKLIPIPHRLDANLERVLPLRHHMQMIANNAVPTQVYWPLQHPALRIHLFPNEQAFIRHGAGIHNEIRADPKQIALVFASEAPQMMRWWWYWTANRTRIMQSFTANWRLFVAYSTTLSDPRVLNDKFRLARALHILFRISDFDKLQHVLMEMKKVPGYKPFAFGKMAEKIIRLIERITDENYHLHTAWSKEQARNMTLENKSKRLDLFLREWDHVVIAELGLKKCDRVGYWKFFSKAVRQIEDIPIDIEYGMAGDTVVIWKTVEFFLDPSYTMNIILLQGPDLERQLLKEMCLEHGFSWKSLRRCIEWIDYDSDQEESGNCINMS